MLGHLRVDDSPAVRRFDGETRPADGLGVGPPGQQHHLFAVFGQQGAHQAADGAGPVDDETHPTTLAQRIYIALSGDGLADALGQLRGQRVHGELGTGAVDSRGHDQTSCAAQRANLGRHQAQLLEQEQTGQLGVGASLQRASSPPAVLCPSSTLGGFDGRHAASSGGNGPGLGAGAGWCRGGCRRGGRTRARALLSPSAA